MVIDTKKVRHRRKIHFETLRDIVADAEQLREAENVEQLGNWTPGQIFEHLAKSVESSVVESRARLPLWRRVIGRMLKPLLLRYGLPSGFQIERTNSVAAHEFIPQSSVSQEEGLQRLKVAISNLTPDKMSARHNIFGRMSARDWEMMHCRHAELHLSFLVPVKIQNRSRSTTPVAFSVDHLMEAIVPSEE